MMVELINSEWLLGAIRHVAAGVYFALLLVVWVWVGRGFGGDHLVVDEVVHGCLSELAGRMI